MLAFLFPGQGSQRVGMGRELIEKYEIAEKIYSEACDVLGFDLLKLCLEGPEDVLTRTENAQVAILTYNHIASTLLKEKGVSPEFVAGHSLGEFSAILCSEMMDFKTALKLVKKRGELMSLADPEGKGGMAAVIGLDDEKVRLVCLEISKEKYVEPVNFNAPGQVVISGLKEAIEIAETKLKEAGAKRVIRLNVSGAFHSKLMENAAEEFKKYLETIDFKKPLFKIVSNVTTELINETNIKDLLYRQMKSPVLWTDSIKLMKKEGVNTAIEVGYGSVITGLVSKIDPGISIKSFSEFI
ncbi:MAG: ACP S-malonyltransferase [Brevinematia bacterium]